MALCIQIWNRNEFTAKEVTYSEALDGEIKQASFQEEISSEFISSAKNVLPPPPMKGIYFSANYEFPPHNVIVDWCDGDESDGRQLIKEISLTKSHLKMILENDLKINIDFNTDDITFKKVDNFLSGNYSRNA